MTISEDSPQGFVNGERFLLKRSETFVVDAYGNDTDYTRTEQDYNQSGLAPELVAGSKSVYSVHRVYEPTTSEINAWTIGLAKSEDISDQPRCYNGATSCTSEVRARHSDFTYYTSGELSGITRAAGDPTAQRLTELIRDGYGNVYRVEETDSDGNTRGVTAEYDARGLFPISITDGLNQTNQTTQVRYDDRFGKLTARVDPNDIPETWSYDDFGILRDHTGPDGESTTDYEADTPNPVLGLVVKAKYRVIHQDLGGDNTVERFNSLGQLVARESSGLLGASVNEELSYDQRNRLVYRSRPHLPGDSSQGRIHYAYDGQDRLTTETYPNNSAVQHAHALASSLTYDVSTLVPAGMGVVSVERSTDARGNSTYIFANRDGQPVQVLDANGKPTSYVYGAFGSLEQIVGPSGTLSHSFDNYGRQVSSNDAAAGGQTTVLYDGFDEAVTIHDPAARTTTILYDELGRRKRMDDADGTTSWTYGDGNNAIGRLVETVSPTGQRTHYGYEASSAGRNRGLPTTVTETLTSPTATASSPPTELTTTYHYDNFSRLEQVDYPGNAGFSVKYGFDAAGHVITASDAANADTVYWQLTDADQGYRAGHETLGNGVVTQRKYVDQTGLVTSIITKHGSTVLQQLGYGYDPNGGNLTSRSDAITGVTESFGYDALNRVTSTTYSNAPVSDTFTYDPVTNGLSHQSHVGDYTYYSQGRDWVHWAGDTEYTHDAFGNIQTRSGPNVPGTSQEYSYTTFNLPSHVSLQTVSPTYQT